MTVEELARLVADMRNAQREYFRTRSGAALEDSKRRERQVDEAIAAILRTEKQRSMF